jgi:hypothetical protein
MTVISSSNISGETPLPITSIERSVKRERSQDIVVKSEFSDDKRPRLDKVAPGMTEEHDRHTSVSDPGLGPSMLYDHATPEPSRHSTATPVRVKTEPTSPHREIGPPIPKLESDKAKKARALQVRLETRAKCLERLRVSVTPHHDWSIEPEIFAFAQRDGRLYRDTVDHEAKRRVLEATQVRVALAALLSLKEAG